MENILDIFELFKKRGKKEAFVYRTGIRRFTFTYFDIYTLSLKMASYLLENGIKKGDRVAIWLPNSPFWIVSYFGILISGAIVVPIDFASKKERAKTIIKLSGAKLVIQSNYKFERLNFTKENVKAVEIEELIYQIKSIEPIEKYEKKNAKDTAEIVYTSGTTGDPKGVILTNENIISNILSIEKHIAIPKGKFNFLSVLPLSHMLEQTVGFLTPMHRGDKIIYLRTVKPFAILEALKEEDIGIMLVVPRILSLLKNSIEREFSNKRVGGLLKFKTTKKMISRLVQRKFGKNFQMFAVGGATLPLDVFLFWKDLGFKVVEGYGLTECSPIVTASTFKNQIPGSSGKPIPEMKIKLDKDNELLVRGKSVFVGYYNDKKATQNAFKSGWFKTGDFASIDKNGNVFIKGRKKDIIVNSFGNNIYPDEIENILNKIKGVKDSCVIALHKPKGEETHAVLLLRDRFKFKGSEIIKKANKKLDSLSQIDSFSIWEDFDFPRTTTLKIQKFKVIERLLGNGKAGKKELETDTLINLLANVSGKKEKEIKESSILTVDLGLNSLSRLELINYLEEEYKTDLEDTIINQNTTVSELRSLIEKKIKFRKQKGLWLFLNRSYGIRIRAFLDLILHRPLSLLFFNDLESRGLPNLKDLKGPAVFISNHVSYFDQPAIMYSLPKSIRYKISSATREEFFFRENKGSIIKNILFVYTMLGFNCFLLPQKSGFRKTLAFMGKLIDNNVSILIFPEGTRTRDGNLQEFMPGIGMLVKELDVPVVPIKIMGMENIYPRNAKVPRRGKCTVIFGKPIYFTTETPSQIIEKSHQAILDLTNK